jgi:hypothetical protein
MNISPPGGRLMRAAICGLLAATVTPAAASAEAITTITRPFSVTMQNPCFATDTVMVTGTLKVTTIMQNDGDLLVRNTANGTGVSLLSGAKYAMSEEEHGDFHISPFQTSFYDFFKLTRQKDETGIPVIVDPPAGVGDDFFMRFFVDFPLGSGGVPSPNSLNTTVDGACR